MQVISAEELAAMVCTRLAPEELTVNAPELLFMIVKECPNTSVETTGKVIVWVVLPVNSCIFALETVSVVVPAAVAVVVKPGMKLLPCRLLLVGAARKEATPEPSPLTPEVIGKLVQLDKVPEVGVPSKGAIKVGVFANTKASDPVSSEMVFFNWSEVVAANCESGLVVRASPPPGACMVKARLVVPTIIVPVVVSNPKYPAYVVPEVTLISVPVTASLEPSKSISLVQLPVSTT